MSQLTTIVCLANTNWYPAWQRHQIIMSALANDGYRVVFVEHVPFRFPKLIEIRRLVNRFFKKRNSTKHNPMNSQERNITIVHYNLLPSAFLIWRFVNKMMLKRLKSLCKGSCVLWTYLPNEISLQAIEVLEPRDVIYDCASNFPGHPDSKKNTKEIELSLIKKANLVLTDSKATLQRIKKYGDIAYVPPGVDSSYVKYFADNDDAKNNKEHTRKVCWFGTISRYINERLLVELVKHFPDWQLIMIGPEQVNMRELKQYKNVTFTGAVMHDKLPEKIVDCDAFVIPYKRNAFIEEVMPAKTFELLATGKPVISVPLESLQQFNDLFYFGEWSSLKDAFTKVVNELDQPAFHEAQRKKRMEMARANLWEHRIDSIRDLMRIRIGKTNGRK